MKLEYWPQSTTQILSDTKRPSSRMSQATCALSWRFVTTVISSKQLRNIRKAKASILKNKSGISLSRLLEGSKHFMISKFAIEISNALTCSWPSQAWSNWVTWMYQKLLKREWCTLRQVPHTMLHQRYGKTSHMIIRAISGVWDASFTKW